MERSEKHKIETEYLFVRVFLVLQCSYQLLEANLAFLWSQIQYHFLAFLISNYKKTL